MFSVLITHRIKKKGRRKLLEMMNIFIGRNCGGGFLRSLILLVLFT